MGNTHLPKIINDRRPHVPKETITIGELFRQIESGETMTKPDADFRSMKDSLSSKEARALKIG